MILQQVRISKLHRLHVPIPVSSILKPRFLWLAVTPWPAFALSIFHKGLATPSPSSMHTPSATGLHSSRERGRL